MSETRAKADENETKGSEQTPDGTPIVRTIGRDFRVEGNDVDGYIGVGEEYRTYANDTEKPFITDEDVETLERTGQLTDVEQMTFQVAGQKKASGVLDGDDEDEDDKNQAKKSVKESPAEEGAKQGQGRAPASPISAPEKQSSTKAAATGEAPKK